ncbi:N-carbamoyl-L-amino-acid hydrolase [Pullulanibacillus pueri]|uniref:Putative hydrolase n=1 Tax=Pullulanibacillus pueri TaxID=1437324 RepID=A0A8J3A0B8_9BACL|nr:Zn-dependent hydrolase [Pullulanibacillus pueri]MBM7684084.1 N-carbamoyl-L-amino-acid hydrolase [Pullulanibacillus pueri]GGH88606.1 putative hydrolase [Pullulanibacillus pueri]
MNLKRIKGTLTQFNQIGYSENGMNRLAYTVDELRAKKLFMSICEKEGMTVRVDDCGNIIARREGTNPALPPVAMGSHLDTVIDGGQYDGTVGVVAGIEVIRCLNDRNLQTKHPIEVICFTAEESSRFGVATIGSKAMAGKLFKEKIGSLKDRNDITFQEAFKRAGFDFDMIENASKNPGDFNAFFEMHIEQGPVLEKKGKKIGIVTGIAAPTRIKVTLEGKASHSGTTPMDLRRDAFLGAAELGLIVERAAKSEADKGTVATVGDCTIRPGAMNVVPGRAEVKIDIRGIDGDSKQRVWVNIMEGLDDIEHRRHLMTRTEIMMDDQPVPLKKEVISSLLDTCRKLGLSCIQMPSGAGHDAMNMASLCPTGLIFIPCRDGLSHHKDEFAALEDIGVGILLLEEEVLKWATLDHGRMDQAAMGEKSHESL